MATNKSSALGKGYCSQSRFGLTVDLQSPHIRTELSDLGTATVGNAHSLKFTFPNTPRFSNLSKSCSTASLKA